MAYHLVRLTFYGPAHFGEDGIGQEATHTAVRSDTLYSAIWSVWARHGLHPDIDGLLSRFVGGEPPFRLSSAFLYCGAEVYLPRPALPALGLEPGSKILKQARLVPVDLFADWVAGRPLAVQNLERAVKNQQGACTVQVRPRVELDRATHRSELYGVGLVAFVRGGDGAAGLWFLVYLAEPALLQPLRQAVALLGENGLGGERSSGMGAFTAEWAEVTAEPPWRDLLTGGDPGGPHCLLSLCNPDPSELPGLVSGAQYDLVERRGWSQAGDGLQGYRLAVPMLTEGSVVSRLPRGRVLDVSPPGWRERAGHAIYRSGLALAVPVGRGQRP